MKINAFSLNEKTVKLFLASFLGLFFELLFIRWVPDAVHVFSFFGNFVLLSCFLGLGIGLAQRVKDEETDQKLLLKFIIIQLIIVTLFSFFVYYRIGVPPPNEEIHLNDESNVNSSINLNIYVTISVFFFLTALAFVPLGKLINRYIEEHEPLVGYTVNVFASIMGIAVFSLLSYLSTPPVVWLTVGLALLYPFAKKKSYLIAYVVIIAIALFGFDRMIEKKHGYEKLWSPYYNLRLYSIPNTNDHYILIGNSFLLSAADFSNARMAGHPIYQLYSFVYRFIKDQPENVLILGSGMGNDVAVALDRGAKHVDAVEIDPIVAKLGKDLHPQKPFNDPRVSLYIDDGRSFLKKTNKKYDLIVFGTIDSHGLFSQMSSIKMENFIYTKECFNEAKNLLTDKGVIYVLMGPFGQAVPMKMKQMLSGIFGDKLAIYLFQKNEIMMYICGNIEPESMGDAPEASIYRIQIRKDVENKFAAALNAYPTDDWPHLFLFEKKIPKEYLIALAILLGISIILISSIVAQSTAFKFNIHFFLLGTGFMLIEAKSITEMGLIFGATWVVNSIVITGILIMIFFANLYLLKRKTPLDLRIFYALLIGLLILLYLFPMSRVDFSNPVLKYLISIIFISMPLFFAAIIFGTTFSTTKYPNFSLASNMLGSMVGGMLEYSSMIYGLKSLYIVGLILYAASYFAFKAQKE